MGCLYSIKNKKSFSYNTWTSDNINKFEWDIKIYQDDNPPWRHIIFQDSPFYFIYDTTLEELFKKVEHSHKRYLLSLSKKKRMKNIQVSNLMHSDKDIRDRLKTGIVLKIKWINFSRNLEYTLYY